MSNQLPQQPNLRSLNSAFLAACQANDLNGLAQFNADLSRVVQEVEQASTSKPSNPDATDDTAILQLLLFSHNVHIASSLAAKAQLEIEQLSNDFAQQINLLSLPAPPILNPVLPASSSQNFVSADNACSSVPNSVLKKWSLLHMAYLFPSKEELEELASETSMSPYQINLWFRNARTRSGWSKLFAHPSVNKDKERLQTLLREYESLQSHGSSDGFKSFLARDELLQLLNKISRWFATTKLSKPSKPDSIRPWVKDILNNALSTIRDKTAGALNSSFQNLPSMPSRKRARTNHSTPSPSRLTQSSAPIAEFYNSPSRFSESSRSSLSQLAIGSSSNLGPIPSVDFPRYLGSLSDEPSHSRDPSPASFSTSSSRLFEAPLASSLPTTCSPVHSLPSLNPVFEMPIVPPACELTSIPPSNLESSGSNLFDYNSLDLPSFNLPIPTSSHNPELFTSNLSDHPLVQSSLPCPSNAPTTSGFDQSSVPTTSRLDYSSGMDIYEDAEEH